MGVVAHGLRERPVYAKARCEAVGEGSCVCVVAIEDAYLEYVMVGVSHKLASPNGHLDHAVLRDRVSTAYGHRTHLAAAVGAALSLPELKRLGTELPAQVHRARHERGPREGPHVKEGLPSLGHLTPVDPDPDRPEVAQVLKEYDVRALAGGYGSHVAPHAKVLRHVDRGQLQRHDRVEAQRNGVAHHAVHVPVAHDGVGVRVVRAEQAVVHVHATFDELGQIPREVEPCRPLSELRIHTHAKLGEHVGDAARLVAARGARGDVGRKSAIDVGIHVVAGHDAVGLEGLAHLV